MFNIFSTESWPAVEVRFTAATETHLYKHCHENPEIQPHFVERILRESEPWFMYPDHVPKRYVFEGYLACNPYRVIVEPSEENGVLIFYPISAHRIKHKDFIRHMNNRRQQP